MLEVSYGMRVICCLLLLLSFAFPVLAAETPVITGDEAFIHIAPDKPAILRLEEDAASVVVGSPKFASVTMDNPRTLLIMPRAEGATSLTVLNGEGQIVMEKRIIVGGAAEKYVRIRRACTSTMAGCRNSQIYYCPDGCSDISLDNGNEAVPATGTQQIAPSVNPNNPPAIPPISAADLQEPQQALEQPQ